MRPIEGWPLISNQLYLFPYPAFYGWPWQKKWVTQLAKISFVCRIVQESLGLLDRFPDLRIKLLPLMEDFLIELRYNCSPSWRTSSLHFGRYSCSPSWRTSSLNLLQVGKAVTPHGGLPHRTQAGKVDSLMEDFLIEHRQVKLRPLMEDFLIELRYVKLLLLMEDFLIGLRKVQQPPNFTVG